MSIQFSLGIIRVLDLKAVPVSVMDGSAIFHHEGSLHGEFTGLKDDTVIQWTQISGVPVTFIGGTSGESIQFVTSDLDQKEFICCTNPGTDAELCAKATFYHFPVDFYEANVSVNRSTGVIPVPKDLTEDLFSNLKYRGLSPVNSELPGYSSIPSVIGGFAPYAATDDQYTEVNFQFSGDSELLKHVIRTEVLEDSGSGFSIIETHPGFLERVLGTWDSGNPKMIRYIINNYGKASEVTVPFTGNVYPGTSETVPVVLSPQIGLVKNLVTTLSSLKSIDVQDSLSNETMGTQSGHLRMTTTLQSLVTLPGTDKAPELRLKAVTGIVSNVVTTIQTNSAIT